MNLYTILVQSVANARHKRHLSCFKRAEKKRFFCALWACAPIRVLTCSMNYFVRLFFRVIAISCRLTIRNRLIRGIWGTEVYPREVYSPVDGLPKPVNSQYFGSRRRYENIIIYPLAGRTTTITTSIINSDVLCDFNDAILVDSVSRRISSWNAYEKRVKQITLPWKKNGSTLTS